MATDKTFKYAGISKHDGEYKVRFANDIMRIKILAKNGHEDIRFFELDEPKTKLEAVFELKDEAELSDGIAQITIAEYIAENTPKNKATGPAATHVHVEAEPGWGLVFRQVTITAAITGELILRLWSVTSKAHQLVESLR